MSPAEIALDHGLRTLAGLLTLQLKHRVPVFLVISRLEDELAALQTVIDTVRREHAIAWLQRQHQGLVPTPPPLPTKPKRPRNTAAARQRVLLAEIAARETAR